MRAWPARAAKIDMMPHSPHYGGKGAKAPGKTPFPPQRAARCLTAARPRAMRTASLGGRPGRPARPQRSTRSARRRTLTSCRRRLSVAPPQRRRRQRELAGQQQRARERRLPGPTRPARSRAEGRRVSTGSCRVPARPRQPEERVDGDAALERAGVGRLLLISGAPGAAQSGVLQPCRRAGRWLHPATHWLRPGRWQAWGWQPLGRRRLVEQRTEHERLRAKHALRIAAASRSRNQHGVNGAEAQAAIHAPPPWMGQSEVA